MESPISYNETLVFVNGITHFETRPNAHPGPWRYAKAQGERYGEFHRNAHTEPCANPCGAQGFIVNWAALWSTRLCTRISSKGILVQPCGPSYVLHTYPCAPCAGNFLDGFFFSNI